MTEKQILIISAPDDSQPPWPVQPAYDAPWPTGKIKLAVEALVSFRGNGANPVINQSDIVDLILRILGDYNQRAAKLEADIWRLNGLLKRDES
jgi:hypothetical protein